MGYFGAIVVARTTGLLARVDGVELFGFRHRSLRDLGRGWQLLETTGANDPPNLAAATTTVAGTTGAPVLAGYVSDSDCALLCTAAPGRAISVAHLPDVTRTCMTTYVHRPAPDARDLDGVVADLIAWGEAGDLSPSADAITQVVGPPRPGRYIYVEDLMFDLVRAVGVDGIGEPRQHSFRIDDPPFSSVAGGWGLGRWARNQADSRAQLIARGMEYNAEQPWEAEAIALENELWQAIYDDAADVAELARRAEAFDAAYDQLRSGRPTPSE